MEKTEKKSGNKSKMKKGTDLNDSIVQREQEEAKAKDEHEEDGQNEANKSD